MSEYSKVRFRYYLKYLLTLLVSVFFFSLTYISASTEFTRIDVGFIVFLLACVLVVEFLIAHLLSRYRIIQNLILAGFTTINILYLNLVLNAAFLYLPEYGQALGLLLSMFILFTFMNMLDENPRIATGIPALFAVATVGVLLQNYFSAEAIAEITKEQGMTSAKNIRLIEFETKPNVYFIALDSIIPKVLLEKNLGLETTAYHNVLDKHFRRFKNFFANHIPTNPSLNSLLALGDEHFSNAMKNNTYRHFFSGKVPSPLFEIFKHNGYETTTFFRTGHF